MRIQVFLAYAAEDEQLKTQLSRHLISLEEEGKIQQWDESAILLGANSSEAILDKVREAQIIVLLLSADFFASAACEKIEAIAFEQQAKGKTRIIPVLARPCVYGSAYEHYPILPNNKDAITSQIWGSEDEALAKVVQGIDAVVTELAKGGSIEAPRPPSKAQLFVKKYGVYLLGLCYLIAVWFTAQFLLSNKSNLTAELDLLVEQLQFKYMDSMGGELFSGIPIVEEVQLSGYSRVHIPATSIKPLEQAKQVIPEKQILITPLEEMAYLGFLKAKLAQLNIAKESNITLQKTEAAPLLIWQNAAALKGQFAFSDSLLFYTGFSKMDGLVPRFDFEDFEGLVWSNTGLLSFEMDKGDELSLDLGEAKIMDEHIFVDSLQFFKDSGNEAGFYQSTVLSGQIRVGAFQEYKIDAPSQTFLRLKHKKPIEISAIEIDSRGIALKLRGSFEKIEVSEDANDWTDIMPLNYLWLWQNHKIQFLLYGFLLGLPLLILLTKRLVKRP